MPSRDHLRTHLAGAGCTVCGASVAAEGIRVLAARDDMAFVELACRACNSTTIGIVTGGTDATSTEARLDLSRYGEFGPADDARLTDSRPIDPTDVAAMRDFLAGHHGDLASLLGAPHDGSA